MPTDIEELSALPPSTPDDTAAVEAGLDALDTGAQQARTPWLKRFTSSVLPPVIALLLILVVWQLVYLSGIKPAYTLPGPMDVWNAFMDQVQEGNAQEAVWNSLRRGAVGFAISVVVATPLGLLIARFRWVRAAIGPIVSGLQTLPSVAWVPAAIIWFGISDAAIYAVVLLGAIPSITNGLVAGIDQTPPLYNRVGRTLGARGYTMVRHVMLPAALPGYVSGLKQGWAFAWRSLMAAELITFSPALGLGLGQLLDTGRQLSDMSLVLASIILILFVGIAIELLFFAPLERRILRTRGLTGARR